MAEKKHGAAMGALGGMTFRGDGMPADEQAALELLRDAAVLGSEQAQFVLGQRYEADEPDRARRYYRLCATRGAAECQVRVAQLLTKSPAAPERDLLVAWWELAAARGHGLARTQSLPAAAALTADQRKRVDAFKRQFSRPSE